MASNTNSDDYRVALIEIAREIATAGTGATQIGGGSERTAFLRRLRAAYLHLAATVEQSASTSPASAVLLRGTDQALGIFDPTATGQRALGRRASGRSVPSS